MIKLLTLLVNFAFSQQLAEPRRHVLSNGMTVLLAEDHSSPLVSAVWGAHVGSSAEPLDFQGSSHYLEHLLLMRGTKNYPPGAIGALVNGRGGFFNGFTWDDYTVYLLQATPERLDELLGMHEDMMFRATFGGAEFEMEKKAVQEEFRLRRDKPAIYHWDTTGYKLYPAETYYSRSTIGTLESVGGAKYELVRKYYEDYYVPNNITLAVVGDFDSAKLLPALEKRFGKYPAKPVARPPYEPIEMKPGVNVVEEEREASKSYLMIALPAPQATAADYFPMELLGEYLTGASTSLLRDELVTKRKLLDSIEFSVSPRRFAGGWQAVELEAAPDRAAAGAAAALELMARVAREGVTAEQLESARQRLLNAHAARKEDQRLVAQELVKAACFGDYRLFSEYEARLKAVTPRDALWAARKYLAPDRLYVGAVHPKGLSPKGFAETVKAAAARAGAGDPSVASVKLPHGGLLLHEPRAGAPMEGFTLAVRAGSRYDDERPGLASAVAAMLTRQTAARDRFALQKYLDENGFLLSSSAGRDAAFLTLQAPAGKTKQALALLRELVGKPALGAKEWGELQKEMVEAARALRDQPQWMAQAAAYELLFSGQPYSSPPEGEPESLAKITPAELQAFMTQRWSLDRTALAYVGPADAKLIADEWAQAARPKPAKPAPEEATPLAAATGMRKAVDMPGKLTAYLLLLWPGPKFGTPEWVRFSLANQAFGGDLAGRLWQLRQKEGLAYSVWARPAALREQPLAIVTMGTALANRDKALAALDRELGLAATTGFSAEDLARVKTSYMAAIDLQDSTAMARSQRLANWWSLGAPPDYRAKLRAMVAETTLDQMNAAAASVLKPGAYWLVEAGQQVKP